MIPSLNKSIHISPSFSWVGWDLYENAQGKEAIAFRLNSRFAELVNRGEPRRDVEAAMHKIMEFYGASGASDTEPRTLLSRCLDDIFGEQ